MNNKYIINTFVDALCRKGEFDEVLNIIKEFENDGQNEPCIAMYKCLLGGCRKFGNRILGEKIYSQIKLKLGDIELEI